MEMDSFIELLQFINDNSRIDVKCVAIQNILGMTGNPTAIGTVLQNVDLLKCLVNLTQDKEHIIRKDAILTLVNISALRDGAVKLMEINNEKLNRSLEIIDYMLSVVLNQNEKNADAACMLLCNLTRVESYLERCVEVLYPHLSSIFAAFINLSYNNVGEKLHYLGPLWSNLSGSKRVRKWLCAGGSIAPVKKLCTFSGFQLSLIRRGGAVGTLRNICFQPDIQDWLLGPEVNILSYLLLPLVGGEEYPDDEMDCLPIDVQFQPADKQREEDPDIRILLLETLGRFCVRESGREFLRSSGVYYILRELHKWEKDRKVLLACENVVDILIRKEEEMGAEDLTTVDVPHEYHEKFIKMDEDFINDK